ncbi:hypothetical protein [Sulfuriroseicoccus oceanibius]|uniref:Amino acid transport protein n=1 Tax=Sulfuriroseicoccus oceanibius TaxID=2707525 RepID=A0A6B3LG95_9BACT|nr:hypothetical protein [Sulfuriroseicoccus oceanibius]QQL44993.1 hypothetical protein G3M56_014200 [Sulfuriroseicoccus oceanibius]
MTMNLDPMHLVLALIFGGIGAVVFWHERKHDLVPQRFIIAIALMGYPYFVSTAWITLVIGLVLCAGLMVRWE